MKKLVTFYNYCFIIFIDKKRGGAFSYKIIKEIEMKNIITDRLIIRKFDKNDWQDLHEYLSDEEVVKYEPYDIYSEDQAKEEAAKGQMTSLSMQFA